MNKKITLTKNTQSIKYLCSKDKQLSKLIHIIGDISYVPHGINNSYSFFFIKLFHYIIN